MMTVKRIMHSTAAEAGSRCCRSQNVKAPPAPTITPTKGKNLAALPRVPSAACSLSGTGNRVRNCIAIKNSRSDSAIAPLVTNPSFGERSHFAKQSGGGPDDVHGEGRAGSFSEPHL